MAKTFYTSSTDAATGVHVATHEQELTLTDPGTGSPESIVSNTLGGGEDELVYAATTPSGEPGSGAWPTGNYTHEIDCDAVGGDITYGLLTVGGSAGHFARVNSGLTSDLETKAQQESAFSGTGIKSASTGSVSWTAGSDTDRFEVLVAAGRPANHGNQSISIQINETDDTAIGPWTASQQITPGIATETDTALTVAVEKHVATGIAAETDAALTVAVKEHVATGIASETDAGLTLAVEKHVATGISAETDTALALSLGGAQEISTGLANETDAALAAAIVKHVSVGIAAETDSALATAARKLVAAGLSAESDSALAPAIAEHVNTGIATETDEALAVALAKHVAAGASLETDAALALAVEERIDVGLAAEADAALSLSLGGALQISTGVAVETDLALALTIPLPVICIAATCRRHPYRRSTRAGR